MLEEPHGYASFHNLAVAGACVKAQAEGDQKPDMKAGAFALCMNIPCQTCIEAGGLFRILSKTDTRIRYLFGVSLLLRI